MHQAGRGAPWQHPMRVMGAQQHRARRRHRGRLLASAGGQEGGQPAGWAGLGCTRGRTSLGLFGQQGAFTHRLFFHRQKTGVTGAGSGCKHRESFRGARVCARGSPGTHSGN